MSAEKGDLEIIYNLQWKNKPGNSGDKANIIGMYDIVATTINWQRFKSYLLKNSGIVGDDVKVSYITDSNTGFPLAIESQADFQIALYEFRRKARRGEIVNLILDRISDHHSRENSRQSNDVETQIDNNEAVSLISVCCSPDTPPEWFITYMNQFKKNITDELTASFANIVSNIKPHVVSQPTCYHTRKAKADSTKRIRKLQPLVVESSHETKDLIKSLKLEGKLERKLEKLEHKTKKIKERKLALFTKSSDSDAGHSSARSQPKRRNDTDDDTLQMDAAPVSVQTNIPHMLGGEVYLHKWEVKNTGKMPWTSKTSLVFTWGSKALKPIDTAVTVPYLKPGEMGTIAVRLQIPNQPGEYECYWHFHHKERRFGNWLGCQVIVDPFDLKGNKSVLETSVTPSQLVNLTQAERVFNPDDAVTDYTDMLQGPSGINLRKYVNRTYNNIQTEQQPVYVEEGIARARGATSTMANPNATELQMPLHDPTDTNCSSDSDNQSIVSLSDSNSSKELQDEFVVVPIPNCFKIDRIVLPISPQHATVSSTAEKSNEVEVKEKNESYEEIPENFDNNNNTEETDQNVRSTSSTKSDDATSNTSRKSDIVIVSMSNEAKSDEYAYVVVDGQKLSIPKKIIKSEYLQEVDPVSKPNDNPDRVDSVSSSVVVIEREEEVSKPAEDVVHQVERDVEPVRITENTFSSLPSLERTDFNSHCSAAGSCYSEVNAAAGKNSRLFIFPQNCPGYELVDPIAAVEALPAPAQEDVYTWAKSSTHYAISSPANAPPLNLSTHDRNPLVADVAAAEEHVPNYQQTPAEARSNPPPVSEENVQAAEVTATAPNATRPNLHNSIATSVHILPETLVSGAVNVASSAINTARSVINMIAPSEIPSAPTNDVLQQPGRWVNGHWVSTSSKTLRETNLQVLAEMGFWNRDLNATLLARYNDDLSRVVAELVQ